MGDDLQSNCWHFFVCWTNQPRHQPTNQPSHNSLSSSAEACDVFAYERLLQETTTTFHSGRLSQCDISHFLNNIYWRCRFHKNFTSKYHFAQSWDSAYSSLSNGLSSRKKILIILNVAKKIRDRIIGRIGPGRDQIGIYIYFCPERGDKDYLPRCAQLQSSKDKNYTFTLP